MRLIRITCIAVTLIGAAETLAAQPKVERIAAGSLSVEISSWGAGEPVVLLPGLGWSASAFELLGPELAANGYRAIAMNRRGVRGSTGPLQNVTLHDYADDVVQLATTLRLEKVHLLGWALGNRIARVVASEHPSIVASVILLAAGGRIPPEPAAAQALSALGGPSLTRDRRSELVRIALFGPEATNLDRFLALEESWPAARAAESAAAQASPFEQWWAGGSAPMLVVQGLDDRTAPTGNGRSLKAEFPDRVELVELPRLGHAALFEAPDKVSAAVLRFLKAHSQRVR